MEHIQAYEAALQLLREFPSESAELKPFAAKQAWSSGDVQNFLNQVAELMLNPACTVRVAELYGPLLPELLNRCITQEGEENLPKHEALCIALGRLIWLFPDAARFAYMYFEHSRHIFARYEEESYDEEEEDENEVPPAKKMKKDLEEDEEAGVTGLLIATLQFLAFDINYFRDQWDWSVLVIFLQYQNTDVRWLTHKCIFWISDMKYCDQSSILEKNFSESEIHMMETRYSELFSTMWNYDPLNQSRGLPQAGGAPNDSCAATKKVAVNDLSKDIVNVQGVLLKKFSVDEEQFESLVLVDGVQNALEELALAVSSGAPVVIQGPVGCGKTSLIEYLAQLTGRELSKDLIKLQLGDQTDCKLLIGSYCCTEVPGEFIWQPGILTQAMTCGQWLLLEDIDCAPVDIVSVLGPVVQSRSLTLPGRSNSIKAQSGFHLFATRRLITSHGKPYVELRSGADILNKGWRKITMQNFRADELHQVISSKWPSLTPAVSKVLKVYRLFSDNIAAPDYDDDEDMEEKPELLSFMHHGRLISTRDLFKFCKRIEKGCNVESADTFINIFQHALDCFCDNFPYLEDRVRAAELVGVEFNISNPKAGYFCKKHKPSITDEFPGQIQIGRATLHVKEEVPSLQRQIPVAFAHTRQAVYLLEKVAVAVSENEPVLLVGETGTGKTSIVQYLAQLTNNKLSVINMNQQSDSIDLLGGYKPVDVKLVIEPLKDEFLDLFPQTFSQTQNVKFLGHIMKCYMNKRWPDLFTLMLHSQTAAVKRLTMKEEQSTVDTRLLKCWKKLGQKLQQLKLQLQHSNSPLVFSFIEGALVKAMKKGEWILLDEINLAEAETLQCLAGVLECREDSLYLLEKGDKEQVHRDKNFRIFACMNPATDVGKKDLPVGIRNRFTEFFMEELEDRNDLTILVEAYLSSLALGMADIENIVSFYIVIRKEAANKLNDGTGHRPHYSLRTLCRALSYAASNPCGSVYRSLYEAFALSFLSQLDQESHEYVNEAIISFLLGKKHQSVLKQKILEPISGNYIPVQGFWIQAGKLKSHISEDYIITKTVQKNLHDLARIVSAAKYPVLLQGETSVGKTSLVMWLAQATGNYCVRVNNHEHTDIQEYTGSYCVDHNGKLFFKEGILVEAMRKGYWIILDELNLAPTEVMEALNRVLDDNRELFLTETQQVVRAHPKFMVFATQNPPGLYGGRKVLSRAFRNRFIELHFSEIPPAELEYILQQKCMMPASYSKKMVAVMQELQVRRRESGVFAGKQGYITLRDLFRWGDRYRFASEQKEKFYDWQQHIADEGYMLLAGRVRRQEEADIIKEVIQKHLERTVDPESLFSFEKECPTTKDVLSQLIEWSPSEKFRHIAWTQNMRRLAILIGKALRFKEPVLLVGNTGCGKTTICQIFAQIHKKSLHCVNCHMHSESADFLGNLRPVRSPEESHKLFEWVDGPLVEAMTNGDYFLADEISLADDSVLERLNSVLEPERLIRVTEKCGDADDSETLIAALEGFRFVATMNPGGDFGKKELSPALRNRFTEIWCPGDVLNKDLVLIIEQNIKDGLYFSRSEGETSGFGFAIVDFLNWFRNTSVGKMVTLSIRDVLTWVDFINRTTSPSPSGKHLSPHEAFIHGACLVFLDGLGSSLTSAGSQLQIEVAKEKCYKKLLQQIEEATGRKFKRLKEQLTDNWQSYSYVPECEEKVADYCGIGPFVIRTGPCEVCAPHDFLNRTHYLSKYVFDTPATKCNAVRLFRAMQLNKPILLEGNPGVGKTSLVTALADMCGYSVVRINLSEQTDISDLFGADLPVEGGESGQFAWRDGPLLRAIKSGKWILLDELNLASQPVLEGLNACLDHRGEIFVSELGRTFKVKNKFTRIFGCQNPFKQGGSRKGLPRSFLNRFTQVYMQPFSAHDAEKILSTLFFPLVFEDDISGMVKFNDVVARQIQQGKLCARDGHLWNFNVRDIFRWCQVMVKDQFEGSLSHSEHMSLIYIDRMRTEKDKSEVLELYRSHCRVNDKEIKRNLQLNVFADVVQLGHSFLERKKCAFTDGLLYPLHTHLQPLESLMKCIEMNFMAILVGPPASGKTSLVRFLASLTGNRLKILHANADMDATELLGGFEQADLNRHLDHAIQDLEPMLQKSVSKCMEGERTSPDRNIHQNLMSLLAAVNTMRNLKCRKTMPSITDEVFICRQRIKSILDLIKVLEDIGSHDKHSDWLTYLEAVKQKVKIVSDKLETYGIVSAGGKFEWVDSDLVQAVKNGYWLLIEDVNFCSPSVLDRLNGLLETDGVLSLTEQGIVGDKITEIRPHDGFRIILTMDPQHGELSAAMRNRGVEIALTSECVNSDRGHHFSDVFSLVQSKGVTDRRVTFYLVRFYRVLLMNGIEKPSSYDFLNIALLCIQNLQKNKTLPEALWNSFEMGFIKNILDQVARMKSYDLLKEEISKCPHLYKESQLHQRFPNAIPTSLDFQFSKDLATLKQQACLFNHLLKRYHESVCGIQMNPDTACLPDPFGTLPPPSAVSKWVKMLSCAMQMVFESCSLKQWKLFTAHLKLSFREYLDDFVGEKHACVRKMLQPVLNLKKKHFDIILDTSVTSDLLSHIHFMVESSGFDKDEIPVDPRWNPYLFRKLLMNYGDMQRTEDFDFTELYQEISFLGNRFLVLVNFSAVYSADCGAVNRDDSSFPESQKARTSLRVMSSSCGRRSMPSSAAALPHPMIPPLDEFISKFSPTVLNLFADRQSTFTEDKFWEVWRAQSVYQQFVQFCCDPIPVASVADHIDKLSVYWGRLLKHIPSFFKNDDGTSSIPSDVQECVQQISAILGIDETACKAVRSKLFKMLGFPSPFLSEPCAKLFDEILIICEAINIHRVIKHPEQSEDLKIIVTNCPAWNHTLLTAVFKCLEQKSIDQTEFFEANSVVRDIKVQLCDAGLIKNDKDDDDDIMEVCQQPAITSDVSFEKLAVDIEMMPLYDYYYVVAESLYLSEVSNLLKIHQFEKCSALTKKPSADSHSAKASDLLKLHKLGKPSALSVNRSFSEVWLLEIGVNKLYLNPVHIGQLKALHKDEEKRAFTVCIASFLRHLQDGPSSSDQDVCINWLQNQTSECQERTKSTSPSWGEQSPILTSICLKLLGGTDSLTELSLKNISDKSVQIRNIRSMLWHNWDLLKNTSFKKTARMLVTSWYWSVAAALNESSGVKVQLVDYSTTELMELCEKLSKSEVLQFEGCNILVEASKSIHAVNDTAVSSSIQIDWFLGRSFCFVGIATLLLFAIKDLVDPALKQKYKFNFIMDEFKDARMGWNFRDWQCRLLTGRSLKTVEQDCHPFISGLNKKCKELEDKVGAMKEKVVHRPTPSQFKDLKNALQHFLDSMSLNVLLPALSEMNPALIGNSAATTLSLFAKKFVEKLSAFVKVLISEFSLYPDIVYPFLTGAEMLSLGLQMMNKFLAGYFLQKESVADESAGSIIMKICSFPSLQDRNIVHTPQQLATFLVNKGTLDVVAYLSTCSQKRPNESITSLLISALSELINEAIILGKAAAADFLATADLAFGHFLTLWKQQSEALQLKKEEEESLFEHKTVTHGGETEDVLSEKEMRVFFPSYYEDFREFLPVALEDAITDAADTAKVDFKELISEKDSLDLWVCHAVLISKFMPPDEHLLICSSPIIKEMEQPDFTSSFLLRYNFLKSLLPSLNSFDSSIDADLIGSHVVAASSCLPEQNISKPKGEGDSASEICNVYHEGNVTEVMHLISLLDNLTARIEELLKEFPENPLLEKILLIVHRIQGFSVKSPLLKFATGLELVLESAELWEQNAAKHVSIRSHLDAITSKVIHYRKMELQYWSQCLDSVVRKQYTSCAPWWFHIYSTICDDSMDMGKMGTVMSVMQQFMEDSSLGQFSARLSLIEIFAHHLKFTGNSRTQKKLRDILFNVCTFYKQFLSGIEEKIASIRKPIEKEIKDFVKISQWNDRNFFSVKKAVEKSHRTLHKCMKRFEKELGQPAKLHFLGPPSKEPSDVKWLKNHLTDYSPLNDIPVRSYKVKLPSEACDSIFDDMLHYYKRVKHLCKRAVLIFPVLYDVQALNDFSGEVIQTAKELQALEVKADKSKEEQKKEAKHILQLRRKALADLFKALSSIGLSYRKGLIAWENCVSSGESLKVPLLSSDLWKRYDGVCLSIHKLSEVWQDTDYYYFKCVAQIALLDKSIQSPARVMSEVAVIEKCKGFASHLFKQVVSQRQTLAYDAENITDFCEIVESLSQVILTHDHRIKKLVKNSTSVHLPRQHLLLEWKTQLFTLLIQTMVTLQQFDILLNSCPEPSDGSHYVLHPEMSSPLCCSCKGDQVWEDVSSDVQSSIAEVKDNIRTVLDAVGSPGMLYSWEHLAVMDTSFKRLCSITGKFQDAHFMHLARLSDSGGKFNSLADFVSSLHDFAFEQMQNFVRAVNLMYDMPEGSAPPQEVCSEEEKQIRLAEKLLIVVLKSVEEFSTYAQQNKFREVDFVQAPAPPSVPEKVFSEKITSRLVKASECLHIHEIVKRTRKMAKHVAFFEKSPERSDVLGRYFMNIVPTLAEYAQMLKFYVTGCVAAHRTSCKLLSILLGLFTDVVQKGFCIPPELLPSAAEQSGSTEFHDIEAGGLGEGEGMKDVSKDIKSEDQLDEVAREGAEKKEDETGDIKEEEEGIEMSEDFEGKLYSPEAGDQNEEESEDETEDVDMDRKIGDVDSAKADKLDEQFWGGDSDTYNDQEREKFDDSGEGATQNESSELVAKDDKEKELADDRRDKNSSDSCPDISKEDEYDGEHPDPYIDAPPPLLKPEGLDLPENMEIGDEDDGDDEQPNLDDSIHVAGEDEQLEEEESESKEKEGEGEIVEEENPEEMEIDETEQPADAEQQSEAHSGLSDEEGKSDKQEKSSENAAAPSEQTAKPPGEKAEAASKTTTVSVHDNVSRSDETEKWESGTQKGEEQHKEGQAEDSRSTRSSHVGRKSTARKTVTAYRDSQRSLRKADENRTVGDPERAVPEQLDVSDKSAKERNRQEDASGRAEHKFAHVQDGTAEDQQAVDVATEEQASQSRPKQQRVDDDDDDDVIALDSSSEEEEEDDEEDDIEHPPLEPIKPASGKAAKKSSSKDQVPVKGAQEDEEAQSEPGEFIPTLGAQPVLESSIHTQHDLWTVLSIPQVQDLREKIETKLDIWNPEGAGGSEASFSVLRKIECIVSPLVQELCEQLRLVLEPTKMTKLKGDYRTGKRLNMKKIIPYIASQFRKDKIWLRRTKPSKRQYQIMLAVDDSSSMADNHSRELAFESLILLGKSLSLLEAGEMSVVTFGEEVRLLHDFGDVFTNAAAAHILESFTFAQRKTAVHQVVQYATAAMVKSRHSQSKLISKDTSQLLIIISDGRGVFSEGGEEPVRSAIRKARASNIFMVFIILDSPLNKDSILDIRRPVFSPDGSVQIKSYMKSFPFPFYVILRKTESLPHVLGEALRQWFELVTSAER